MNNKGKNNPNYKHGKYVDPRCDCGRSKDPRSIRCSICAHRSFPVDGENYPISIDELKAALLLVDTFLKLAKKLKTSRKWATRMVYLYKLDIDHFRPGKYRPRGPDDVLILGNKRQNSVVKRVVLEHCLLDYTCNRCGQEPVWEDEPLTLQLHHINGNSKDNRIENIEFLCPNCHTQTPTYTGRNVRARSEAS